MMILPLDMLLFLTCWFRGLLNLFQDLVFVFGHTEFSRLSDEKYHVLQFVSLFLLRPQ